MFIFDGYFFLHSHLFIIHFIFILLFLTSIKQELQSAVQQSVYAVSLSLQF